MGLSPDLETLVVGCAPAGRRAMESRVQKLLPLLTQGMLTAT